MYVNLVRAVREAARLSKPEFAKRVGKEASTIGAWELDPGPAEARRLSEMATAYGLHKVAHDLLALAGEAEAQDTSDVDLGELSGDEEQIAKWLIAAYRNPKNSLEKLVTQLNWVAKNTSESGAGSMPPELRDLSPQDMRVLIEFVKAPNAFMIAAAIAGGGNPPSAFATPQDSATTPHANPKKNGEHLAKVKRS